jgi:hypothetical protein
MDREALAQGRRSAAQRLRRFDHDAKTSTRGNVCYRVLMLALLPKQAKASGLHAPNVVLFHGRS